MKGNIFNLNKYQLKVFNCIFNKKKTTIKELDELGIPRCKVYYVAYSLENIGLIKTERIKGENIKFIILEKHEMKKKLLEVAKKGHMFKVDQINSWLKELYGD